MPVEQRRVLVLSQGPVPIPGFPMVEGGGLRAWGLATGLNSNNAGLDITVAFSDSYVKGKFPRRHSGIAVRTWNPESLPRILEDFDTIVVSYCQGDLSIAVADNITPDQQLSLDCYVPIYVEVSARKSANLATEARNFEQDTLRWAHVLRRGDLFICANDPQKRFYQGVIAALGRLNPLNYGEELILITPFGTPEGEAKATRKPITRIISNKKSLKILWFGGIYPWFDLIRLVESVEIYNETRPAELIIVGAKNPFTAHPDFTGKYEELVGYIEKKDLSEIVHVVPWVDYDTRADWYLDSDVVVLVNEEGPENEMAWRTRLVDFVWAGLPLITNGGDPLSELLIASGGAIGLDGVDSKSLARAFEELDNPLTKKALKRNVRELSAKLRWKNVTSELSEKISEKFRARDLIDHRHVNEVGLVGVGARIGILNTIGRLREKVSRLRNFAAQYGFRQTAIESFQRLRAARYRFALQHGFRQTLVRVYRRLRAVEGVGADPHSPRKPKMIFVSHQLDTSGAPFVFMDVVKSALRNQAMRNSIDVRTFTPVAEENLRTVHALGIRPTIYHHRETPLSFVKGDVLFMNSLAYSSTTIRSVLESLRDKTLETVYWYAHEASPERFLPGEVVGSFSKFVRNGRIQIMGTASECNSRYKKFFDSPKPVRHVPYRLDIHEAEFVTRDAEDFEKLRFVLPGAFGDGRKGQLTVLYAFIDFYRNCYLKDPGKYRDFHLHFIGDDQSYPAQQVGLHGSKELGRHFIFDPVVTHEKCLEFQRAANVTLCYSVEEALPLFVYEGMAFGHVLIRNDSSGSREQIIDGKNGLKVTSNDYGGLVDAIERIANKSKTSNATLKDMSRMSNRIARKATMNRYTFEPEMLKDFKALNPARQG